MRAEPLAGATSFFQVPLLPGQHPLRPLAATACVLACTVQLSNYHVGESPNTAVSQRMSCAACLRCGRLRERPVAPRDGTALGEEYLARLK